VPGAWRRPGGGGGLDGACSSTHAARAWAARPDVPNPALPSADAAHDRTCPYLQGLMALGGALVLTPQTLLSRGGRKQGPKEHGGAGAYHKVRMSNMGPK
jgi:hypothetical protein